MKFFIALTSITLVYTHFQKISSNVREDSLNQAYKSARHPKDKISVLEKLIEVTQQRDLQISLELSEQYLKLSNQYGNDLDKAHAHWMYAFINKNLENYDLSIEYYLKARNLYLKLDRSDVVANVYNNLGNIFKDLKKYESAREYYFKSIRINRKYNDFSKLTRNYANLVICETKAENYDQGIKYSNIAIEFARKLSSTDRVNELINLQGNIYFYKNDFGKAREYYFRSFTHMDSAENKVVRLGMAYNNIGETYVEEADYKKASEFYEKAMIIKRQGAKPRSMVHTLINLSKLALLENQPEKAIAFIEEIFPLLENSPVYEQLKEASDLLVEAYKNKVNFTPEDIDKILKLNKKYLQYIDELKLEKDQKVSALIVNREEINEEAQYLQRKTKSIHNRSLWIIAIAVTVVLGLLILLYYREKRFKGFIRGMWEDIRDV